jgi:hypothetical protein
MQNPHRQLKRPNFRQQQAKSLRLPDSDRAFSLHHKMKRWVLLAFVGLVGCNSYVDPDWYNKTAFTEHLTTLYAYPSVPVSEQ